MHRILIGSAAIAALFATSAFAADLAPRPYTKAPVMVDPGYNWTGFYAGLNGGYSWGKANTNITGLSPLSLLLIPVPVLAPFHQDVNGGVVGGQIGYNWQIDRTWVLGLEGDIQWSGERSSSFLTLVGPRFGSNNFGVPVAVGPDFNSIITQSANLGYDLRWFGTFRGRAGVLVDPQTLLYATGGLAVGEFRYSSQTTTSIQVFTPGLAGTTPLAPPLVFAGAAASSSDTRVGWTLGAGVERKFSPNWSGKLEYLYMDFGSKTFFAGTLNQADVSFHDHIFRAGFNYAFNPAPVVARY